MVLLSTSLKKMGLSWQWNLFFLISVSPNFMISLPIFICGNKILCLSTSDFKLAKSTF